MELFTNTVLDEDDRYIAGSHSLMPFPLKTLLEKLLANEFQE
jgi:hypothetical protein